MQSVRFPCSPSQGTLQQKIKGSVGSFALTLISAVRCFMSQNNEMADVQLKIKGILNFLPLSKSETAEYTSSGIHPP